MSSLSLKAAALVLLGASQRTWGQEITHECGPSSNGFDYEVVAQEGFTIHWSMDTAAETISFQVVSTAVAWTSIGFGPEFMMIGSDAVIGLPDDASVVEHEMPSKNPSGVVPFLDQEITEASVSQDSASTTVSFTRPLVPAGAKQPLSTVPGDATIIIFAFGMDNTLGYHGEAPNRGGVVLDLFCGDTAAGGDGSAAGTPSPAAAASSTVPSAAPTAVVGGGGGGGGGATGEEATPAPAAVTGAPTLGDTAAPAAVTAAPTLAEGATMAPTIMMAMTPAPADMPTSSPDGDRDVGEPGLDTSSTPAPAAGGDSVNVTTAPTSAPTSFEDAEDGSGQDTDGASRVAGGKWAAAAVTGVVAMLAALSL